MEGRWREGTLWERIIEGERVWVCSGVWRGMGDVRIAIRITGKCKLLGSRKVGWISRRDKEMG